MLNIPLMQCTKKKKDIEELVTFLQTTDRFTNGPKVREFEKAWSNWLSPSEPMYSLFVNSGASANFMTLAAVRELYGEGEVLVSPIGWSSDISSIFAAGLTPVFVDINRHTLAMDTEQALSKITDRTRAVLLTHVLGYNGLTPELVKVCREKEIPLIEDVCESHGALFQNQKCGSIGTISNFSFYYAHHMSTIEGGMICTKDERLYRTLRMYRSHGMLRECDDAVYQKEMTEHFPELHAEFIFMVPGYNMRSTELNAVIGLSQLKRLDRNIQRRRENYHLFMELLDQDKFYTDFSNEGNSNYAFVIVLRQADPALFRRLTDRLTAEGVEFRRGTAGGGNLIRQPFVSKRMAGLCAADYPNAEYIHKFGLYTGNYPGLEPEKIRALCELLNTV